MAIKEEKAGMKSGTVLSLDCVIHSPLLKASLTSRQPKSGFCLKT
jgi:hypothetical protein